MKYFSFFLFVSLLVIVHSVSNAQLSFESDTLTTSGITADDFDVVLNNTVFNAAARGVNLTWEREIIELAEEWQTAVCDVNACYLPHVNSMGFELDAESDGNLDVHVYPNDTEGYAIVKVTLTDATSEDNTISAVYYFNRTVSSTSAVRITNAIKVFPNPASDIMMVEEHPAAHEVVIYSLDGKVIHSQRLAGMTPINISHLKSGNYIINILDTNGGKASTNILTKQ